MIGTQKLRSFHTASAFDQSNHPTVLESSNSVPETIDIRNSPTHQSLPSSEPFPAVVISSCNRVNTWPAASSIL